MGVSMDVGVEAGEGTMAGDEPDDGNLTFGTEEFLDSVQPEISEVSTSCRNTRREQRPFIINLIAFRLFDDSKEIAYMQS